jgi:hypothetical protein
VTTTVPGHVHQWTETLRNKPGSYETVAWRTCRICWAQQKVVSDGGIIPPSPADLVSDHGGIVDYDGNSDTVKTGDGMIFTREELERANPGVPRHAIQKMLRELAYKRGQEREHGWWRSEPVSETRWNSDDALRLILEEIKHADDPLKSAGEWITKFTNGVTEITRKLE